jgi:ectoine hydroxylase-related dioxygenase (phytanoyl-CoA dioxygenase family)
MRSGMIVVQYALSDVDEGQGGFCCIPGSHKATYPEPLEVTRWHEERDLVINPALAKGDAIIFNEALTHGTLPWKGDHQRRAALYRYSPHWVNFQHVIGTFTLPDWALELDERERSVLEMPHRYGRQVFNDSGELVKMPIVSDFLPVD